MGFRRSRFRGHGLFRVSGYGAFRLLGVIGSFSRLGLEG